MCSHVRGPSGGGELFSKVMTDFDRPWPVRRHARHTLRGDLNICDSNECIGRVSGNMLSQPTDARHSYTVKRSLEFVGAAVQLATSSSARRLQHTKSHASLPYGGRDYEIRKKGWLHHRIEGV